jgi:hypothetical protein
VTLIGLIAKNGILIVEFANHRQIAGLSKLEAVRDAALIRLRPILMTTAATIAGHFPLTLVTGAGAAARNSIGLVLVGGMAIGTVFTLFVVPALYPDAEGLSQGSQCPRPADAVHSQQWDGNFKGSVALILKKGCAGIGQNHPTYICHSGSIWPSTMPMRRSAALAKVTIVSDGDDGFAQLAGQVMQDLPDVGRGVAIQIAGRLVGQDDQRVIGQRPDNRDPLALAAGELVRVLCPRVRADRTD